MNNKMMSLREILEFMKEKHKTQDVTYRSWRTIQKVVIPSLEAIGEQLTKEWAEREFTYQQMKNAAYIAGYNAALDKQLRPHLEKQRPQGLSKENFAAMLEKQALFKPGDIVVRYQDLKYKVQSIEGFCFRRNEIIYNCYYLKDKVIIRVFEKELTLIEGEKI